MATFNSKAVFGFDEQPLLGYNGNILKRGTGDEPAPLCVSAINPPSREYRT